MAWNVFYGGNEIVAVNDASYEAVSRQLEQMLNEGNSGWIELSTSTDRFRLLYTPGVPVYFQYFDENQEAPIANGSPMRVEHDLA